MNKVLLYMAPGFEEIEAVTIIDLLRRSGIDVTIAGLSPDLVTGSHGISIAPDRYYVDIDPDDYDCLVLPGGQPGTNNLKSNPQVLETVRTYYKDKKLIGAICAAPTVLLEAGILEGRKVTSYPSEKVSFDPNSYLEMPVVIDGKIITSRGVGTAIDFALQLVRILKGDAVQNEQADKILWTTD
jgi:4-methyl-5(b-hydroxyethyl)-thiazole monophosphate biosynthesis